jgi:hypothetical protein
VHLPHQSELLAQLNLVPVSLFANDLSVFRGDDQGAGYLNPLAGRRDGASRQRQWPVMRASGDLHIDLRIILGYRAQPLEVEIGGSDQEGSLVALAASLPCSPRRLR